MNYFGERGVNIHKCPSHSTETFMQLAVVIMLSLIVVIEKKVRGKYETKS